MPIFDRECDNTLNQNVKPNFVDRILAVEMMSREISVIFVHATAIRDFAN